MKKAFESALAWLLVLGQLSWAMPVEAAPLRAAAKPAAAESQDPAPQVRPNRKAPSVNAVPQTPVFGAWPKDEEIFRARVFSEPLVPIGATTPEENAALARALTAYQGRGGGEWTEDLVAFLEGHQLSPWRASLQLSLGAVYRRTGYFTRALGAWEEAWGIAKSATTPQGHAVADRAVGELAQLHARLGDQERLVQLFAEIEGRDIGGSAGELIAGAKQGLWQMQNQPERAFRCGPLAIDRILASTKPGYRGDLGLHTYPSTSRGTTLLEMRTLANEFELGLQAAFRQDQASPVLVPALVHWKAGHFAALVKEENGRYLIQDATFGEEIWLSRRALDDEISGYMLVREGSLPEGWRSVPDAEAEGVRGKGATTASKIQNQKPCDHQSGGSGGGGGCGGFCPKGLASYSFHTMLVNLHITDTPVGYSPPRGPAVNLSLTYNQREAFQPQVFSYGNVGPMWNFGWQSYIEDDPTTPSQPVDLYVRGGGQETYTGYNAGTQSYGRHEEDRTLLVRVSSDPVRYERRTGDGSGEIYAQPDGALTFPRKVFLTRSVDPQGNAVSFTYDASLRLVAVTDAIGQVTTLSYELPADPLKISKVTDPFGRFATLEYDASSRLVRITDVIGMQSSFEYGPNDFIKAMTTPYGTTTFSAFDQGRRRWIEATDPLGGTERLEYVNDSSDALVGSEERAAIPYALGAGEYPTGFYPGAATNYSYRNTFYWSKLAMARAPGKYQAAKLIHWLHTPGLTQTAGVIENEKEPMESMRTFYQYPDQGWQITGSYAQPSAVGRVVEDGSSQISHYEYNARGKATRAIDPLGRETVYVYGNNNVPDSNPTTGEGVDLLQIRQKNGPGYDLLWSATYNAQHLALTITDASGQTTTYSYNGAGQLLTVTTPPRAGIAEKRTTSYVYDANGYLQSVTGPATGATTSFTYDSYGRVRTVTDSDDYTITYDYDALDRMTRMSYPDGTSEETAYNRLDAARQRDRLGRWTQTFYDALRRPVAMLDPLGRTTTLQWCACGSLDKVVDPNGNATRWERDLQGRVTSEAHADNSTTERTYESTSSRVKQIKDAKQQAREYQYFLDNNLKEIGYKDSSGQPDANTPTVSLTYDPVYSRLSTRQDGTGTTTYSYNPITAPPALGAGQLASMDGPLPSDTVALAYDELGRARSESINGVVRSQEFDALGRATSETNALGAFSYAYVGVTARLSGVTYPNGQTTTFDYLDNLGDRRLTEIHNKLSGGATLSKFNYTTEPTGRVDTWTQQLDATPAKVYEYGYDLADQVTSATLKATSPAAVLKSYGYGYDKAGNRTSESIDSSVAAASFNNLNQLLSQQAGGALRFAGTVSEPANVTVGGDPAQVTADNRFQGSAPVSSGTGTVAIQATDPSGNVRTNTYQVDVAGTAKTLTYDLNGNLMSDGVRMFEWDVENRLRAVNQGTRRSEFTYDGAGLRVQEVEKDGPAVLSDRRFLWCGLSVCEERDATGTVVTKRFFGQGVQEGASNYFYTRDHLGSIRELTDTAGAIRARYDYDPYGRITKLAGDKDSVLGFTGHYTHAASGLTLAPYRAYDSEWSRWISPDPAGLTGGLNLYGYVLNDPANLIDPTGFGAKGAAIGGGIGVGVGAIAGLLGLAGGPTAFFSEPVAVAMGGSVGAALGSAIEDWKGVPPFPIALAPPALPPSTPAIPPPAIPPAIPTTPPAQAMPMSQPTPAPPLPVPVPAPQPTPCPKDCNKIYVACAEKATREVGAKTAANSRRWVNVYAECCRGAGCKPR